uniref:hypothetical protein n=1 Tax=Rheinheimera sp. TaxID=1869214 RepID=UPI0040475EA6
MKVKFLVVLVSAVACLILPSAINNLDTVDNDSIESSLLACVWMPWCDEPDIYSPILQPKDNKTETQDAKDEKLA